MYVRDFIDIGNGSTITVNADEFVNKPISNAKSKNDIVGSLFGDDSSAFNAQTHTFLGQFDGDVQVVYMQIIALY